MPQTFIESAKYNNITSSKKMHKWYLRACWVQITHTTFHLLFCAYLSASCIDAVTNRLLTLAEWDNYLAFVCIAYERHHLQFNEDG